MSLRLECGGREVAEIAWRTNTCPGSGSRQVLVLNFALPGHCSDQPRRRSYWIPADQLIEALAILPLERATGGVLQHDVGEYPAREIGQRLVEVFWRWDPASGFQVIDDPHYCVIDFHHVAHLIGFVLGRREDDPWYPEALRQHRPALEHRLEALWAAHAGDEAGRPLPVYYN